MPVNTPQRKNQAFQFGASLGIVVVVAGTCYSVAPFIGYKVVALLLLFAVSVIAMLFDIWPVLCAAVLSALAWNFFFIPPRFTFTIGSADDVMLFLMYFVIALVNGVLTFKIRAMEKLALKKQEREYTINLYKTIFNSLSHELQTPISTIIGATDSLRDQQSRLSDHNKTELITEIAKASDRLNDQVRNLLNMSRLETGQLTLKYDWCDISELIYTVTRKLADRLKQHKLEIRIPENVPLFWLDFGLMEQVLYNIIDNAAQYTPAGTAITIEIRITKSIMGHFSEQEQFEQAHRDASGQGLVIIISDNGPGFPEEEIHKVFDKFYRLQNTRAGGTGLGLSIVKGFIEAHGGRISLVNCPGGGAEFMIELPAKVSYINKLKNE